MSSRQELKGSSRSTRDDSRRHERRYEERRSEDRHRGHEGRRDEYHSRSRSPNSRRHRYSPDRHKGDYRGSSSSSRRRHSDSDEEVVPAPPPPPRITKISIDFSKPKVPPIKLNVGGPSKAPVKPKPTVASVFNNDDDDEEPEEMPAEARMRMRNIGRDTPTSAGPNSFGKTKQGFCDSKKVFEKSLKEQLESNESKPKISSLPQTIYKIKP